MHPCDSQRGCFPPHHQQHTTLADLPALTTPNSFLGVHQSAYSYPVSMLVLIQPNPLFSRFFPCPVVLPAEYAIASDLVEPCLLSLSTS